MLDKSFIFKIYRDGARLILNKLTKYDFNQKEAEVYPFNYVPGIIINTIVFIKIYVYTTVVINIYIYMHYTYIVCICTVYNSTWHILKTSPL